ncbi:MAG TPA: hypothetical protein VEP90_28520, partial [Methylomirabilota bacterium]|nr:hypothetical protein [Methylomirabilota bacterium]
MNSVLIDGAVPRTESERVSSLLAEAEALYNQYHNGTNYDIEHEIIALEEVYQHQMLDEDFEFWNEVEDEIIDLINEIL